MNNITVFNFKNSEVRTAQIDGEPWFVAADVCAVLEIKNTTQAVQKLDNDERSMLNIGRQGKANIVNEFGLYGLILMSRKKEAVQFKRWVIHEVLPQIRKTGAYVPAGEITVKEHTRALPSGKKEIVLSEKAKTEIGGIVKSVLQAEIRERENIRDVLREVIRDEVADWFLKDGIEEGTFNTSPTADGLPAVNWVVGISHGATALYNLIQQYQKCLREKNDLLLSENADLKNRMKQISSWVR